MMNQDQTFRIVFIVAFLVVLPSLLSYPLNREQPRSSTDGKRALFILASLRPAFLAFWLGLIAYNSWV
jgi:hypothetical protein